MSNVVRSTQQSPRSPCRPAAAQACTRCGRVCVCRAAGPPGRSQRQKRPARCTEREGRANVPNIDLHPTMRAAPWVPRAADSVEIKIREDGGGRRSGWGLWFFAGVLCVLAVVRSCRKNSNAEKF